MPNLNQPQFVIRPSKDATIRAALSLTPQYAKLLRELQKSDGRIIFPHDIAVNQNHCGSYVTLYDKELNFGVAFLLALMGEDGFNKFKVEIESYSPEEQQVFLDELTDDDEDWDEIVEQFQIPESPHEWMEVRQRLLNGKIQFPGLYMLFGILESFQWLDSLTAPEILNMCEQAGLDSYQNRIDDEDYVSKRLREYRRWQSFLRMSRI